MNCKNNVLTELRICYPAIRNYDCIVFGNDVYRDIFSRKGPAFGKFRLGRTPRQRDEARPDAIRETRVPCNR